jgi:hypothetical protein
MEDPRFIAGIIGRDAELRAIGENTRQQRERCRRNDPALVMTGLAPGIGKQDEGTVDRGFGQGCEQQPRIVLKQPDIPKAGLIDLAQQPGDAIDKRLAADKASIGMRRRLPRKMLTGAETNFEPQPVRRIRARRCWEKQTRLYSGSTIGDRNFDFRQQCIEQNLSTGPERPAEPSTIQRSLRRIV